MSKTVAIIWLSLFTILFCVNCAYYNTLFNAKRSFNQGIKIIQSEPDKETHPQANKYFDDTIDKCWKLIDLYSDKSKYADDALLLIIKSEYHTQKYVQAKNHANQFLLKYPKSELLPEVNLWYAKLLLQDKEIETGREYLSKVINLSGKSRLKAEAYYELGNIAFQIKNYSEASEYFKKALNEKVDKQYAAFINFYLGESYFLQNQYKEAIKQYKKVENFSPSLDIEYKTTFNLGKCNAEIGEYDQALTIFRKMLTAPRFKNFISFIKTEIAIIYKRQGKIERAVDLYTEIVKESAPNSGTAQASLNLAQLYENDLSNIDSAVFYYGMVRKIFSKFEKIEIADDKFFFLSELKKIKDGIKRDKYLIFKLETDPDFKDSLYTVQYEDSILGGIPANQVDTTSGNIDTTSILFSKTLTQLDSMKTALTNHLLWAEDDTLKQQIQDSIRQVNSYIFYRTPKRTEPILEKRKLPQIQEDLKENEYHLAEFYLLQVEDYDSARVYYYNFLRNYSDSLLTPKAIYSLYYVYSNPAFTNDIKRDSLEHLLLTDYPESPFSQEILKKKNMPSSEIDMNSSLDDGYVLFLEAENLYFAGHTEQALLLYRQVSKLDSTSLWSAKAQFALAWIYENDLQEIDLAVTEYQKLKENFNQPEFLALASKKTAPVSSSDALTAPSPVGTDSFSQTLALIDTTPALNINTEATVDRQLESGILEIPMVSKTKEYRDWRQNRTRKD